MSCNNIDGLNYIEFYSGVGGWTMAIRKALEEIRISCMDQPRDNDNTALRITPTCVADYDHSELCNEVYNFNFKTGKSNSNTNAPLSLSKGNEMLPKNKKRRKDSEEKKSNAIERLSIKNLEDLDAFIWMMSPPCQPHTRQHNNQHEDVTDPRSKSFLHLCHLISQIKEEKLPSLILLENVIGFEYSNSCNKWREVLKSRNYKLLHFHLSPTQIGIPNDRPRYYSIAFRSIPNNSRLNLENMNIDLKEETKNWFEKYCTSQSNVDDLIIFSSIELLDVRKEEDIHTFQNDEIRKYLDDPNELINEDLFVSEKLLNSDKSWCFDIITPSDRRSSCFTQSYGRYIRGTGSVLYIDDKIHSDEMENEIERRFLEKIQLVSPQDRKFDSKWADGVDLRHKLRYLSGTEIARLMGFPLPFSTENNDSFLNEDGLSNSVFQFPPHLTLRQQWKLLGNSINVHLAAKVAELGVRLVFVLGSKTV